MTVNSANTLNGYENKGYTTTSVGNILHTVENENEKTSDAGVTNNTYVRNIVLNGRYAFYPLSTAYPTVQGLEITRKNGVTSYTARNITDTNELVTRPLKLYKNWNDQGSLESLTHTPARADITLDFEYKSTPSATAEKYKTRTADISDEDHVTGTAPNTTPKGTTVNGNTYDGTTAKVTELPLYTKDGELANYIVEEISPYNDNSGSPSDNVGTEKLSETPFKYLPYRYIAHYDVIGSGTANTYDLDKTVSDKLQSESNTFNLVLALDSNQKVPQKIQITNELPVYDLYAAKTWDDFNDIYGLRPDSIADKLHLKRKIESDANYTFVKVKNASGSDMEEVKATVISETKPTHTETPAAIGTTNNQWTYQYKNLARYDKDGKLYTYKIEEDINDIKGYRIKKNAEGTNDLEGSLYVICCDRSVYMAIAGI